MNLEEVQNIIKEKGVEESRKSLEEYLLIGLSKIKDEIIIELIKNSGRIYILTDSYHVKPFKSIVNNLLDLKSRKIESHSYSIDYKNINQIKIFIEKVLYETMKKLEIKEIVYN